jgi:WD40 repeat protein
VSVYDVASGTELYSIPAPTDGFTVATFSAGGSKAVLATPSYNPKQAPARVSVWDVASTKRLASLDLPGVGAVSAALAPDGKRLVTAGVKQSEKGGGECALAVWDAAGQKKGEYSEEGGFNTPFAAAAPDSKSAAVVTSKGALAAFDLDTAKLGRTFDTGRRTPVAPPAFSPDGKSLAVACQPDFATNTAPVLVFDWQTGKVKHTFASSGPVVCLAFSPDGKWLVTGSSDTTATVWDLSQEAKGK